MSEIHDLTRWNRAGLRRFRYVQGNAVEYLESLRAGFAASFPVWSRVQSGTVTDEDPILRIDRILANYNSERGDWGWELARAFARAAHVLGEHLDAYANEGFLGTATQWDNLRKLVAMLGYHPAPPSSASTLLVIEAKPNVAGLLARGYAVKYSPPEGGAPCVFETLHDVDIDAQLNALRLHGWNRSVMTFNPDGEHTDKDGPYWQLGDDMAVSAGQYAILLQQPAIDGLATVLPRAEVRTVGAIDSRSHAVHLDPAASANNGGAWYLGYTRLLLGPKKVYRPHLNGTSLLTLDRDHGLTEGDLVSWQSNGWEFGTVQRAEGASLLLDNDTARGTLFKLLHVLPVTNMSGQTEFRVPTDMRVAAYRGVDGRVIGLDRTNFADVVEKDHEQNCLRLDAVDKLDPALLALYIVRDPNSAVGQIVSQGAAAGQLVFNGNAGALTSNTWVVLEGPAAGGAEGTVRRAARITSVTQRDHDFELSLDTSVMGGVSKPSKAGIDWEARLRQVGAALDQTAMRRISLRALAAGEVGARPASEIKGVSDSASGYGALLARANIRTIADLAKVDLVSGVAGISPARLREFKAHAECVTDFGKDGGALVDALDQSQVKLAAESLSIAIGRVVKSTSPGTASPMSRVDLLYGPFRYQLLPRGSDRNETLLQGLQLKIAADAPVLPETLKRGRLLLLTSESTSVRPREVVVDNVQGRVITLKRPVDKMDSFTLGDVIVRANVVSAGHGESRGEAVLGSGNATVLNPEYLFAKPGVSFVADPTMPAGVRADVEVRIDGQAWKQVGSLRDSAAADAHYTVRMNEDGNLTIGFGDGRNGRRVSTGTNNIRIAYRIGSGLAGNLAPGSLITPMKPHRLVETAQQPLAATGGNDVEDIAALRENAPASLLTLERAVSVKDFANLAASQTGVWQAQAFARPVGSRRQDVVEVVLVPAGGAEIIFIPEVGTEAPGRFEAQVPQFFLDEQRDFLLAHAQPGIVVQTSRFKPVLVDLYATVRVKSTEFDPVLVVDRVRGALVAAFDLRRRKFGQALHLSEVIGIVEAQRGVENSDCAIELTKFSGQQAKQRQVYWEPAAAGTQLLRTIAADDDQVVYFDARYGTVTVSTKEYRL